jgi:hypothetical protein
MIDEFLTEILHPQPDTGIVTDEDLERAEREKAPLCDEASLQIFRIWYQFGGMKRPLTPVEAAEMPAWLARDFVYLLARIRQLGDASALGQWVERSIYKEASQDERLYPPRDLWT